MALTSTVLGQIFLLIHGYHYIHIHNYLLFKCTLMSGRQLKYNVSKTEWFPLLPHLLLLQGLWSQYRHLHSPRCSDEKSGGAFLVLPFMSAAPHPTHIKYIPNTCHFYFPNLSQILLFCLYWHYLDLTSQHSFSSGPFKWAPSWPPCFHCCFPVTSSCCHQNGLLKQTGQ